MKLTQHEQSKETEDKSINEDESDIILLDDERNHKTTKSRNIIASHLKPFRERCGLIANNPFFQNLILALIMINAIMMGIGTYDFVEENDAISDAFDLVDMIFLVIFTVELSFHFFYLGLSLFNDGWLVFDFVTIITSWTFNQFQVIRAFRVFRALRLITRIKVLKNLVVALLSVVPKVGAILSLMLLVFYIFAVMFTSLFKDIELEENYFSRLDWTLLTLFQMVTLDWSRITRELIEEVSWARYPIIVFILISSFIVYNLIVAVLCDAIFVLREMSEKEDDVSRSMEEEEDRILQDKIDYLSYQIKLIQKSQKSMKEHLENIIKEMKVVEMKNSGSNMLDEQSSYRRNNFVRMDQ